MEATVERLTLRLEIAMIDAPHMAVLQGVNDLAEHVTNESITAEIDVLLCDHAKEIALCEIHDEEDTVAFLEDAMEGNNA